MASELPEVLGEMCGPTIITIRVPVLKSRNTNNNYYNCYLIERDAACPVC